MSGLSLVADYESDSEDDTPSSSLVSSKLPVPSIISGKLLTEDQVVDDPEKHKGRIRSFPHERGNWSTFVYVPFAPNKKLFCFINILLKECSKIAEFDVIEDFHLSLSRTVVLKYHWITTFFSSLKCIISGLHSFNVNLNSLEVYTNEEKTRTFIGLKADEISSENLENVVLNIDTALLDFKLQTFYKDPSFHVSLIWCIGDKKKELNELIEIFTYTLQDFLQDTDLPRESFGTITVNQINCKSGNKLCSFYTKASHF